MSPKKFKKSLKTWTNQVPLVSFNSGKFDMSIIKENFVNENSDLGDTKVRQEENKYTK